MCCRPHVSLWVLLLVFIALAVDMVAVALWEAKWWVSTIVGVVLVLEILTFNYQCRTLMELVNVADPGSYGSATYCEFISVYN